MKSAWYHVRLLLQRLGLVLVLYSICRFVFLLFNRVSFQDTEYLVAFLGGLRFDISAIALINAPLILLSLFPGPWLKSINYQRFLHILLVLINLPGILLNLSDVEYFKFTSKRSTIDFFDLFFLGEDMSTLLPTYIKDYWYLFLIFIAMAVIMIRVVRGIQFDEIKQARIHYGWQASSLVLFIGLSILGFRGGFQLRPIDKLSAMAYGQIQDLPLIINTPFSIMKSYGKDRLKRMDYYPEETVGDIYSPIHHFSGTKASGENVVIIIMESFTKEYVGKKNKNGVLFTPFLDSLSRTSISFPESYANGRKSIEALPAITAGIPVMMDEPFITSPYGGTLIDALPRVLDVHGYTSAFYHGGKTGTMGFDKFCRSAGFDSYIGLEDYPDQNDFDGNWGIYDRPFFEFTAQQMAELPAPFFSTVFSLSSHHPYSIPEEHLSEYSDFEAGLGRSIRYADDALRSFFNAMKHQDYYENTLFVITADHIPNTQDPDFLTPLGCFSVPIVFMDTKGKFESSCEVAQHIDIQATIVDYLGIEQSIVGFGKSLYACEDEWTLQYLNNMYQIYDNDLLLRFDGHETVELLDPKNGFQSVKGSSFEPSMLGKLKAMIQQYNNRMIDNRLSSAE